MNLLDASIKNADQLMREKGNVIWMFHGRSLTSEHILLCPFKNAEEKRQLFTTLRLYTVAKEINEYVVISEAWMKVGLDPKHLPNKSIANDPEREEVLIGVHVKRTSEKRMGKMQTHVIKRKDDGTYSGLEQIDKGDDALKNVGGDLFDLIPPTLPSEISRKEAENLLKMGQASGFLPKINPILRSIPGGKAT